MPCYTPVKAMLITGPGGRSLSFKSGGQGKGISLPCGRCIGCRLERARQWAVRIMHESKMHDENSFLTLTYDESHYPTDSSLSVQVCQLFLKRLRERLAPKRIRFFLCGEYGEKTFRAHYHMVLFGHDFPDKKKLFFKNGFWVYTSELLDEVWGQGGCRIGSVTFESATYVANYATKKVVGKKEVVDAHYNGRRSEFLLMSRRPGIGRSWIDKYSADVYPADEIIVRGVPARPPRYYDRVFEVRSPSSFEAIKLRREGEAGRLEEMVLKSGVSVSVPRSTNARRLAVRKRIAEQKLKLKLQRKEL